MYAAESPDKEAYGKRKFICVYYGIESELRHIECPDHDLCFSCEYLSIFIGACIFCDRDLTPGRRNAKQKKILLL